MSSKDLRAQKTNLEAKVAKGEKLRRLLDNADFQEIIVKGFCEAEALTYLGLNIDSGQTPEAREECLVFARAGVALKQWLRKEERLNGQSVAELGYMDEAIFQAEAAERADEQGVLV